MSEEERMSKFGYQLLDGLVESKGNRFIHDVLLERLSNGDSPAVIAQEEFGIPYAVLRGWIELHCPDAVALAGRARADILEWEATDAVRGAVPETVALAKLQSDHFMKLAGRLDRAKWGDKYEGVGGGAGGMNFTIVIGDAHPAGKVIEGGD